jgi:hypothetical protein
MKKSTLFLFVLLAVAVAILVTLFLAGNTKPVENAKVETYSESPMAPVTRIEPYGKATTSIGSFVSYPDVRLRVLGVTEESRCPSDVQCIQAGKVSAEVEIISGMGTSTDTMELGDTITTEAEQVTLVSVDPYPVSTREISDAQYIFTFEVTKRKSEPIPIPVPDLPITSKPIPSGACYVGGCSSQLCTDNPDMVSTCEYKEEYACYQTAVCERQQGGQCGWTSSAALNSCLQQKGSR